MRKLSQILPLFITILLVAGGIWLALTRPPRPEPTPPAPLPVGPALATLGTSPDWSRLQKFDGTLSAASFGRDLREIYALPEAWQPAITFDPGGVTVKHHHGENAPTTHLSFAAQDSPAAPLPPLSEIHIALDPGHIGGEFAILEQRNFQPFSEDASQIPVREGDLALATARHLKKLLEEMGATVTLVRETSEPVTDQRPQDFLPAFPDRLLAEKIFYRTAEIRARAELVNEVIQPDLVFCLHYNADAWNDPADPWAPRNHFHLLLNGAYMAGELVHDDERFEMLRHLFSRTARRALPLAQKISDVFLRELDLVPYNYSPAAPALPVDPVRPIYARNLLANRLYEAPTIFLEPYVMNHREVYHRVQLGDYEGFREINGTPRRSLVREYAYTLAQGIAEFYRENPRTSPLP
ncbi:N-acetylmuramoyl-L-alanine amidase [Roseibacillus ishigakijimensis]|nr:N-acetylmuramoyl-L-alanine amidase [Roseibacillus ishigakijimensis]